MDPQTSSLNLTTAALHRLDPDQTEDPGEREAVAAVDALPPGSAQPWRKSSPALPHRYARMGNVRS